ncbi:kinase-like protein [Serendipita vermifera]|nr:kinase-like protein [Serendipita vermifera]
MDKVEGLAHSQLVLDAKDTSQNVFLDTLLRILQELHVPTWSTSEDSSPLGPNECSTKSTCPPSRTEVQVSKVAGSMSNAVYYLSAPSSPHKRTLLLRIYGISSASLVSRPAELRILHILSSQYQMAPHVYGTFGNGRVEEYLEAKPLNTPDLRDPEISRWIAVRMAELHRVEVERVLGPQSSPEISVARNIRDWIPVAKDVLEMNQDHKYTQSIDLDRYMQEWTTYYEWITSWENEARENRSRRVFCHNDVLNGNVLRLQAKPEGAPDFHQICFIDFEYAALNPVAFDIANHLCEWMADYDGDEPSILYANKFQIVKNGNTHKSSHSRPEIASIQLGHVNEYRSQVIVEQAEMDTMDQQVMRWLPAVNAMWSMCAIIQATEMIQDKLEKQRHMGVDEDPERSSEGFEYLVNAKCRIELFRQECRELGVF